MTEVTKRSKSQYPTTLTCSVSGAVLKTNPKQAKALLDKPENKGKTPEEVYAGYVCRSVRAQAKKQALQQKREAKQAIRQAKADAKASKVQATTSA